MDRVDAPDPRALFSYREFHLMRQRRNQVGEGAGLDYIALVQDKSVFSLLMRALDAPAPELLDDGAAGLHIGLEPGLKQAFLKAFATPGTSERRG